MSAQEKAVDEMARRPSAMDRLVGPCPMTWIGDSNPEVSACTVLKDCLHEAGVAAARGSVRQLSTEVGRGTKMGRTNLCSVSLADFLPCDQVAAWRWHRVRAWWCGRVSQ